MYERVNPNHPDKVADRIAGAIVDLSYSKQDNPKVAVEVLIGHGKCHIINETSVTNTTEEINKIVWRIAGQDIDVDYVEVPQDEHLAENQSQEIRCGDNGIFKGTRNTIEQERLSDIANYLYKRYKSDGKYILDGTKLVVCQSNAKDDELYDFICNDVLTQVGLSKDDMDVIINPLGEWTGGTNVDTGATNRKLGSDMGDAVTGGGLHGKDLSKADVALNIYAHLKAKATQRPVEISCAIGDSTVDGIPYSKIVEVAKIYIYELGGFEKLAEWGLI